MRKHRDFVYIGEPIPKIDMAENADFVLGYQKAILLSLVKSNLLTQPQYERCMEELKDRQYKSTR